MLSFLTRVYRKLTDIFCWVWLIGFTVFMAIVFNESMDWLFYDWAVFVGVIAGLVIGFWTELIILPPIMVLFEINDKLDFLVRKEKNVSEKDKKNEEEIITTENEDCVEKVDENQKPVMERTEDDNVFWICTGCGKKNSDTLIYCEHCGKYKQVLSFCFVFQFIVIF